MVVLLAPALLAACTGGDDGPAPAAPVVTTTPATTVPPTTVAPTTTPATTVAPFEPASPVWEPCGDGVDCATLTVPLDHADPAGETIELALVRRPATAADRIGHLLVNPGGPGGSGVDFVRSAGGLFDDVAPRFDVVGFDPRGVGASTPIDCLADDELDAWLAVDLGPDDAAERAELLDRAERFAAGCLELTGELLAHVATADVVDDMDLIRRALGEEQLTYLGFSYGTLLGVRYLEAYGDRARAMVLDAAVDPTLPGLELAVGQARGFDAAVEAFLADCAADDGCPFGGADPGAALDDLLARVEDVPLLTQDGRPVGPGLAELGILAATYNPATWPVLAQGLADAELGDGDVLLLLADLFTEREDGRFASNAWEALYAVNCLDDGPLTIDEIEALARRLDDEGLRVAGSAAWFGAPCASWPVTGRQDPRRVDVTADVPVVVVGTTGDPATPYRWAVTTAEAIPGAALLTREGEGHTAVGRSPCIAEAAREFLVTAVVPADRTCPS